jgi:hypothetical protein
VIQSRTSISDWGELRAIEASNGWRAIEWVSYKGKKLSGFEENSLDLLKSWSARWK